MSLEDFACKNDFPAYGMNMMAIHQLYFVQIRKWELREMKRFIQGHTAVALALHCFRNILFPKVGSDIPSSIPEFRNLNFLCPFLGQSS